MIRRAAFWLFLVSLAVGFGWVANEQWRLWLPGLFNWQAEQQEALSESDPAPDAGPGTESRDSVVAAIPESTGSGSTDRDPAAPQLTVTEPTGTRQGDAPASNPGGSEPAGTFAAPESSADPARASGSQPSSQPPDTALAAIEPTAPRASTERTPTDDAAPAAGRGAQGSAAPNAVAPQAEGGQAGPEMETGRAGDEATAAGPAEPAPESDTSGPHTAPQSIAAINKQPSPDTKVTTAPTFDIVRVERDGRAVIAGRAEPGAEVVVRSGEQVIDRVRASHRGDWVAIPTEPLSPGDQQLSAVASREGAPAIRSEQVVVVAVPKPARPQPAPGEAASAAPPVAVLLPRDGKGPGRILQAPGRLSAEDTLALMTVSYDESGKVLLSGEAPPGVPVRIYVDNRPAALVVGDGKGAWSSGLDDNLAPGTYTLRLDQLDAQGQPVARIETPFTRVSDPPVEGELQVDYVVVQPGNSLWRIARRLSGEGLDYVHIYGTNKSQIRDPDLIYPGQVFEIPAALGSAG